MGTYVIISLIIFFIIIFAILCLLKKTIQLRSFIFAFFGALIITCFVTFLSFLPSRCYETPELAMESISSENIVKIIDGTSSCLIISGDDPSSLSWNVLLKKDDGYFHPSRLGVVPVETISQKGISAGIYHVKRSDDYYLIGVVDTVSKNMKVFDSLNSEFCLIESAVIRENEANINIYFVYAELNGYSDQYQIDIYEKTGDNSLS